MTRAASMISSMVMLTLSLMEFSLDFWLRTSIDLTSRRQALTGSTHTLRLMDSPTGPAGRIGEVWRVLRGRVLSSLFQVLAPAMWTLEFAPGMVGIRKHVELANTMSRVGAVP